MLWPLAINLSFYSTRKVVVVSCPNVKRQHAWRIHSNPKILTPEESLALTFAKQKKQKKHE